MCENSKSRARGGGKMRYRPNPILPTPTPQPSTSPMTTKGSGHARKRLRSSLGTEGSSQLAGAWAGRTRGVRAAGLEEKKCGHAKGALALDEGYRIPGTRQQCARLCAGSHASSVRATSVMHFQVFFSIFFRLLEARCPSHGRRVLLQRSE